MNPDKSPHAVVTSQHHQQQVQRKGQAALTTAAEKDAACGLAMWAHA